MHQPIGYGESAEMYLKSIHELQGEATIVPISSLAARLSITVVSATEMIHRLVDQGLVEHLPYKGVALTIGGLQSARAILRRQRLWECFLFERLQLPWERVYDLACKLEHAAGPEVMEALAIHLSEPTHCPHGNPIPSKRGELEQPGGRPLSELEPGEHAVLRRVEPVDTSSLNLMAEHGMRPGKELELQSIEPVDGLRRIRLGDDQVVVGSQLAGLVYVD
jgi:DtxR family Mn-dependent transcriptional regulator